MITAGLWKPLKEMVGYIGLTEKNYVQPSAEVGEIFINSTMVTEYIARRMLELDIERMAWTLRGRPLNEEPSTPKSRGESVQEWLYTQVHRSDLGYRVCDMTMSVLRLALRVALEHAGEYETNESKNSTKQEQAVVRILLESNSDLVAAGIPIDEQFMQRVENLLKADISKIMESAPKFPRIEIVRKLK
jgi:hypothetical protein